MRSLPGYLLLALMMSASAPAAPSAPAPPSAADELAREARALAEAAQKRYGPDYVTQIDAERHIVYVSALDQATVGHVVRLLGVYADEQRKFLFRQALPWNVTVVLPTVADYRRSLPQSKATGFYREATRTLESISLSDALLHEFTHALHHADQALVNQRHAPWICEGLAMLFQRSACREGPLEVLPGRDLVALQDALRGARAYPLAELAAKDRRAFTGGTEGEICYAEAHYVMFYLHRLGKLREFYETYKADCATDPTGARSLEKTLGQPLDKIDANWQAWVLGQKPPWAPARPSKAMLGVKMEAAAEGVRVAGFVKGSAAERAGRLKIDDVILSVAGQSTPTPRDLTAAVQTCRPGETVDIEVVRDGRTTLVKQLLGLMPP